MKGTVGIQARAVNKKAFTADFAGVAHNDPGLVNLLVDKETGRLLVQAGDDRESVGLKQYPGPATLLFPAATYSIGNVMGGVLFAEGIIGRVGEALLESVRVVDQDNQGKAFDIILLSDVPNLSTFTNNTAPAWNDLDATKILGYVHILGTDYVDVGSNIKVAQKIFPMPVRAENLTTLNAAGSIFAIVIAREAATYSSNVLKNVHIDLFVKQS